MYAPGDLVILKKDDETHFGEVVGVDTVTGDIEVSCLRQTKLQEGRLWQFAADDEWDAIKPSEITKHVKVQEGGSRKKLVDAWHDIGFVPGGDGMSFCRVDDEARCELPLYQGDEDDSGAEDEGAASSNPAMHGYASDGFVVPDDEASDFEFADPDTLADEAAKFVRETHQAVHDFDKWKPKDRQAAGIKAFIERMDYKATIETDNNRFAKGKESISTSRPPLKKRRK